MSRHRIGPARPAALAAALSAALLAAPAQATTVYVSNEKGNSVSVIDVETLKVTATWPVGRRPRGITVGKDGSLLYVCASDDDRIDVLDTKTGKIVRSLRSGPTPSSSSRTPRATRSTSPTRTTARSRCSTSRRTRWWPRCRSASSRRGWG